MDRRNRTGFIFVLLIIIVSLSVCAYYVNRNLERTEGKYPVNLGLDLQGGVYLVLEVQDPGLDNPLTPEMAEDAKVALQRRIDQLGVVEPEIERLQGENWRRIIVGLPGVTDIERAREVLGTKGMLQFRIGDKVVLSGDNILKSANPGYGGRFGTEVAIHLEFTKEGSAEFAKVTRANIGKDLGIWLGEDRVLGGIIQEEIRDGKAEVIGSSITMEKAQNIAMILRGGTLPAPIEELEARTVSATLGEKIIKNSIYAGIIGIIAVILFMIFWYKIPGIIASAALIVYALILSAAFLGVGATLTLPGIAGFLLSVGMAVDANVIIFERIKDEMANGKRLRAAIDAGFHRAFGAILDGNLTTLLVALVLFYFGSHTLMGFAITLSFGIIASMISAVFVTRVLLNIIIDRYPERFQRSFAAQGGAR